MSRNPVVLIGETLWVSIFCLDGAGYCRLLIYFHQLVGSTLWGCVCAFTTRDASLANRKFRQLLMKEATEDMDSLSHARQLLGNLALLLHQVPESLLGGLVGGGVPYKFHSGWSFRLTCNESIDFLLLLIHVSWGRLRQGIPGVVRLVLSQLGRILPEVHYFLARLDSALWATPKLLGHLGINRRGLSVMNWTATALWHYLYYSV